MRLYPDPVLKHALLEALSLDFKDIARTARSIALVLSDFRDRLAKAQAAAPQVAKKPGGPELLKPVFLELAGEIPTAPIHSNSGTARCCPQGRCHPAGHGSTGRQIRQGEPIRVVKVEVDGKELLLATDLEIDNDRSRGTGNGVEAGETWYKVLPTDRPKTKKTATTHPRAKKTA